MDVLLLGYSDLARRRLIPALEGLQMGNLEVASRSAAQPGQPGWPPPASTRAFTDYRIALEQSSAPLVYISTINSAHAEWAERALESNKHVVVDKPAFLSLEEAERLTALARERNLCLAEASVWGFHRQVQRVHDVFAEAGSRVERLSAVFSFPPLPDDNFRYRPDCGGGALWDLGPYAVTPGRHFFGCEPDEVRGSVLARRGGVDTAFSVMMDYPDGRSLVGQYGFTTGYSNSLELLGPGVAVSLAPAFTSPPDAPLLAKVNTPERRWTFEVPASDSFALYFERLISDIQSENHEAWRGALLEDARTLDRLRRASGAS